MYLQRRIASVLGSLLVAVSLLALLSSAVNHSVEAAASAATTRVVNGGPPPADPIAYWSFDDGADPTADLISGNHPGDLHNGIAFTDSVPTVIGSGRALDFDGVSSYVEIADDDLFDFQGDMSVSFWLKVDQFDEEWEPFITKSDSAWRIQRYASTNQVVFATTGTTPRVLTSTVPINDGQWHHIVAVSDGSVKTLYVDGVGRSVAITGTLASNDAPVWLGRNAAQLHRAFDGNIDDLRFYDVALNTAHVAQLGAGDGAFDCAAEVDGDGVTDFVSNGAVAVQRAVDAGGIGATVKVAGYCVGTDSRFGTEQTLHLTNSVTLEGGYSLSNWLTPTTQPTTLDADGNGRAVVVDSAETVTLTNLTLFGAWTNDNGGGLYNPNSKVVLSGTIFIDNQADNGGAIYSAGQLEATNVLFEFNRATQNGGALFSNGNTTVIGTEFVGNFASSGAAIYADSGSNMFVDQTGFQQNQAALDGGAVYLKGGKATIKRGAVLNNSAGRNGGGFVFDSAEFKLNNLTIAHNQANGQAGEGGGAVWVSKPNAAGDDQIKFSTIVSNSAPNAGSDGIFVKLGSAQLASTIVAHNGAANCTTDGAATVSSNGFNIIGDDSCGLSTVGDQNGTDPLLGGISAERTFPLRANSPAFNTTPPGHIDCRSSTDQLLQQRPIAYNCESGAVEQIDPVDRCFVSINDSNSTDYAGPDAITLQIALNDATAGDLIKIAGTCAGFSPGGNQSQTAYIDRDLTLRGGYKPTNWAVSNFQQNATVLSAVDNTRVVFVAADTNVTLDSLAIQDGFTVSRDGAGIYNQSTALTLTKVIVHENFASDGGRGGGLHNYQSRLTLNDSIFIYNSADGGDGGAISSASSEIAIADSNLSGNHSRDNGGAIAGSASTITISATTFSANSSKDHGGAIASFDGTLAINDSFFDFNDSVDDGGAIFGSTSTVAISGTVFSSNSSADRGGALSNKVDGQLAITNTMFITNVADSDGAAIYTWSGVSSSIVDSLFQDNYSDMRGGAFYLSGSSEAAIHDTTFIENKARVEGGAIRGYGSSVVTVTASALVSNTSGTNGSAIAVDESWLRLENSTISGNSANVITTSQGGGALHIEGGSAYILYSTVVSNTSLLEQSGGVNVILTGTLGITASIVAHNEVTVTQGITPTNCAVDASSVINSGGYNIISDGGCGLLTTGDITNTNPLLLPLADNGGATWTHMLAAGSPASDYVMIGFAECGTTVTSDQRGVLRPFGSGCDVGAVEVDSVPTVVGFGRTQVSANKMTTKIALPLILLTAIVAIRAARTKRS